MDKYSVGTPTFSQTGPSLGSRERLHPLCPQCDRKYHYDKVLRDQCRLMTALLGQGWGSKDQYDPSKDTSHTPQTPHSPLMYTYVPPLGLITILASLMRGAFQPEVL